MSEGDPADTLHLVHHGRVAIEVHRPGKGRSSSRRSVPGTSSGSRGLLAAVPLRTSTPGPSSPCTTAAIDTEQLRAPTLTADPVLGLALSSAWRQRRWSACTRPRIRLLDLYGHDQPR